MSGTLVVLPRQSPLNGGETVAGAQCFVYDAGTTTKRNTYTTSALAILNSNPHVADANGRFSPMWVDPGGGDYKIVLAPAADTDPPTSPFWTEDNIPASGSQSVPFYERTAAEISAGVTPTSFEYEPGDVLRYGWSTANTGAQNATVLANAALVWVNGGPKIRIPAGVYSLSQFVLPAGRGLIIEGQGPTQTKLVHSTSGSLFTLGADDIQLFGLRDIKLEPSATSSKLLDWSGEYQAFGFEFNNVELHEGSSGNTSCIGMQIVGGTNASNHQKHYFKWWGGKVFGLGTGFKIDGSVGAAANDFTAVGFQIQGCAGDGIWIKDSGVNRLIGSIENCGDGATTYNYRITGSISSENLFIGRLENTITPANVPYYIDPSVGVGNRTFATISADPASPNTALAPAGCLMLHNGREFSNIEERSRGLRRFLGAATTDYLLRFMLDSDTMGGKGLFGVRTDGRLSWATGTNPADWDTHLERTAVGGLQAHGGVANRVSNQGNVTGAVAVNCANGWTHRLVLTGNITVDAPTNPTDGAVLRFILIQDGTGGRTVGFDTIFEVAGGAYTMTAGANAHDTISFVYSSVGTTWFEVSRSQALA